MCGVLDRVLGHTGPSRYAPAQSSSCTSAGMHIASPRDTIRVNSKAVHSLTASAAGPGAAMATEPGAPGAGAMTEPGAFVGALPASSLGNGGRRQHPHSRRASRTTEVGMHTSILIGSASLILRGPRRCPRCLGMLLLFFPSLGRTITYTYIDHC